MPKDRLAAFTDAVLAIIMTVLVLELERPAAPTLEAFWDLREAFFAYALSFWWLGSFWISHHNMWVDAKRVDASVIWWSMVVMFCLSLVPYTTSVAGSNFGSAVAQGFYGLVIVASTAANVGINRALARANADVEELVVRVGDYCRILTIDCVIKLVALLVAVLVWPPAMMWGVALAAAFIYTMRARWNR